MMFLFSNFYYQTYVARRRQLAAKKSQQVVNGDVTDKAVYRNGYITDDLVAHENGVAAASKDQKTIRRRDANGNSHKWAEH